MESEENQATPDEILIVPIPNGQVVITTERDGTTKVETTQNGEASTLTSSNGSFVQLSSESFGIHARKYDDGDAMLDIERFGGIRLYEARDGGGLMDIGQQPGGTEGIGISFFPDGDRWLSMGEDLQIQDSFRGEEEERSRNRVRESNERNRSQNRHARAPSRRRSSRRSRGHQSRHRSGSSRHH